jgi:hypothetical protein
MNVPNFIHSEFVIFQTLRVTIPTLGTPHKFNSASQWGEKRCLRYFVSNHTFKIILSQIPILISDFGLPALLEHTKRLPTTSVVPSIVFSNARIHLASCAMTAL